MKTDANKLIGFFGIGIFTYKVISGLTYSFCDLIRDILISLGTKPIYSFWISEITSLSLFIFFTYFIVNWVFNNHLKIAQNIKKYFLWSFLTYFILQILQIIYPSIRPYFEPNTFEDGFLDYFGFLKNNYTLYFIQSALYYLGEIIAILIIYNKIKKANLVYD